MITVSSMSLTRPRRLVRADHADPSGGDLAVRAGHRHVVPAGCQVGGQHVVDVAARAGAHGGRDAADVHLHRDTFERDRHEPVPATYQLGFRARRAREQRAADQPDPARPVGRAGDAVRGERQQPDPPAAPPQQAGQSQLDPALQAGDEHGEVHAGQPVSPTRCRVSAGAVRASSFSRPLAGGGAATRPTPCGRRTGQRLATPSARSCRWRSRGRDVETVARRRQPGIESALTAPRSPIGRDSPVVVSWPVCCSASAFISAPSRTR